MDDLSVHRIPVELLADADAVIRFSNTTFDIRSAQKMSVTVHSVVTLMNHKADYEVLRVFYDQHSSAKIVSAEIFDAGGKSVRKLKKREIQDKSAYQVETLFSDVRYLELEMRHGTYPYSVEYTYEQEYTETQNYPDWHVQGFRESVQTAELVMTTPVDLPVHSKWINSTATLNHRDDGTSHTYTAVLSSMPAIDKEPHCPPAHDIFPRLMTSPQAFKVEGFKGSMQNWNAFGRFMYELNMGSHVLSDHMVNIVQMLVAGEDDPVRRIDILYDYLKTNMRYVSVQLGIGGWKAFDAKYVESNKYGDCKALTWFMKGMLEEIDIAAYPALISTNAMPLFHDDFVSPGAFNHVILHVPEHDIWLECTSNTSPTGYLGEGSAGKPVLLITPDGGIVSQTPETDKTSSLHETRDSIFLKDENWTVHSHQTFTGGAHELCRALEYYYGEEERQEYFVEHFPLAIQSIANVAYHADDDQPSATCAYQLTLRHLGSQSGPRYFLPLTPLNNFDMECGSARRKLDYLISETINEQNQSVITLPEGYEIESLPSQQNINLPEVGSYTLRAKIEGGQLHVDRKLQLEKSRIRPELYSDLCNFFKMIRRADGLRVVLIRKD